MPKKGERRAMKILQRRGPFVDVEVADGVRLFNLRVKRTPDGSTRVYAPNAYGSRVASLSPAIANQIAAALGEPYGRDQHTS